MSEVRASQSLRAELFRCINRAERDLEMVMWNSEYTKVRPYYFVEPDILETLAFGRPAPESAGWDD